MTQAIWSNPKNYGHNETTSQCARPQAAHLWLKKVFCPTLMLTAVPRSVTDTAGDRKGCLNVLLSQVQPPPSPEPCSAWGGQELWPDCGDAQKMQHSYCQLSGVCASVINGRLAFCPENCLRSGDTWQSKSTLLMKAGWEFARFSVQNAWRRQWQPTPVPLPGYWKIPWTEEPGRLQSIGSQRVRHNWATSLLFTSHTFF